MVRSQKESQRQFFKANNPKPVSDGGLFEQGLMVKSNSYVDDCYRFSAAKECEFDIYFYALLCFIYWVFFSN